MSRVRFLAALLASKLTAGLIRLVAKGRGTNLPGRIALKLDPEFLSHFRGIAPERTIFVTGTNGKTTTVNLLYQILTEAGCSVVCNLNGANMLTGAAVPLLKASSLTGRVRCDYLLLETDERYVSKIGAQLPAGWLCVTNIQKDQVQRNGQPSVILNKLREAVRPDQTLFINEDEPNCCSLQHAGAARVVSYAITPTAGSKAAPPSFFSVSMPCPVCHSALQFDACNLTKVGRFHCPGCGLSSKGSADHLLQDVNLPERRFTVQGRQYTCHYNEVQFLYSYAAALAVARELGIAPETIAAAFERFQGKSDRVQQRELLGRRFTFYKTKQENSENLQNIVDAVTGRPGEKVLLLGLDEFVGYDPPYLDACYLFDCDYMDLQASGVTRWSCMANYEGNAAALALSYSGMDPERGTVLPFDNPEAIRGFLSSADTEVCLVEENPFWEGGTTW